MAKDNVTPSETQGKLFVSEIYEGMQKMKSILVELGQIYLDPNNPRLEVFGPKPIITNERIQEEGIQQNCLAHLQESGLTDLMKSVQNSGFCTIDRIVLKKIIGKEERYIVVEGNRRVATLKILLDEHKKGNIIIPDSLLAGMQKFEALVYEGDRADIAWIIQGFRHAPKAIKEWDDFSKAKFLADLEKKGKNPRDIARTFNISGKTVSNLIRAYNGFEKARKDEDYGENLKASDHFGFFSEVIFSSTDLVKWLDWDEKEKKFRNLEHLNKFLGWIDAKKITVSPDTRDNLPKLLVDPQYKDIMDSFENDPKRTIRDCRTDIEIRKPRTLPLPDVAGILDSLKNLKNQIVLLPLTPVSVLGKTEQEKKQKGQIISLLQEMVDALNHQIKMLKINGTNNN